MSDDAVRALREALKLSPENVPLRQHLADTLLSLGRAAEAEQEYRTALAAQPDDDRLKLGLAGAFYQQGKDSPALVLVESLASSSSPMPRVLVLYARLLLRAGDRERAAMQYRRALEFDASVGDADLAERLGVSAPGGQSVTPATTDPFVVEGRARAAWDEPASLTPEGLTERPSVSFQDVGGMESLKEEIRLKIIHPLTHPELYRAYGKPIGGGLLMYGPPGCGKTHLARATAGEISATFISVGISEILDMWIGNSEKNLHQVFEQARRVRPCVLFFDEVDALGASRSDMRQSGGRHLINQFLSEMDGVGASNDGVLILAATNAPWHIDPAFRRPGRFDRVLFVPPPDTAARAAILRILVRGKPTAEIDYEHLARRADSFSGADLKAVIDLAVEHKLREAMRDGIPKPLTSRDLESAVGKLRPSTKEWFSTARNYALYANQGGAYDDVLKYMKLS